MFDRGGGNFGRLNKKTKEVIHNVEKIKHGGI